ncbi:hypothetical protein [Curtobacterium aurantiacum]|uniref:hypothetical protein n=1 Tax=Curtobacterium aurantiacum TaxID=3236919 RepID=UPI001BDF8CF3|nr:hypothetical protein [Curtobacterium flaccumfaciens]MBT1676789.1 hypothetical protein [Curtobacterium flaccumfaciens pv. flaccumfaciens]
MKNATPTMPNATDISERRRHARQDQRVIASNFRNASRNANTGPIKLARTAKIRPGRMLLAWLGIRIMMPDMMRLMETLNMSTKDVFRGTRSAD